MVLIQSNFRYWLVMEKKKVSKISGDLIRKPEWSSGFPYFLQFKSEFGNKEFMI